MEGGKVTLFEISWSDMGLLSDIAYRWIQSKNYAKAANLAEQCKEFTSKYWDAKISEIDLTIKTKEYKSGCKGKVDVEIVYWNDMENACKLYDLYLFNGYLLLARQLAEQIKVFTMSWWDNQIKYLCNGKAKANTSE